MSVPPNGMLIKEAVAAHNAHARDLYIHDRDEVDSNDFRDCCKCLRVFPSIVCEFSVSGERSGQCYLLFWDAGRTQERFLGCYRSFGTYDEPPR
jgi:hypothetical protein